MDHPTTESVLKERIRAIPKTETHLHIEGALPYDLLTGLDPERFPPNPFFRAPGYRYPNFVEFETLLVDHAVAWYTGPDRYHEACKRIFRELAQQNVRYLEASIHLAIIEFTGSDGHEIISAIKTAAPENLVVKVVGALTRDGYTKVMAPVIDDLHNWDELDGIDMHGQEWLDLEPWAPPVWRRCKEAGKIIKVHAGEFGGAEKAREALDVLGAERIQHGVRIHEDPDLVSRLADEGVVLDMCPISNEKLKVVDCIESHPIRQYHDAGIPCTVNTDDPLCFANTITEEFETLSSRIGFEPGDVAEIAKNGFRYARLEPEAKASFTAEIDTVFSD